MSQLVFCFLKSKPPAICGLYQAETVEEPSWLFLSPLKRLEASSTLAFHNSREKPIRASSRPPGSLTMQFEQDNLQIGLIFKFLLLMYF